MFKLNRKGELVATNGFDGGTYQPRYESQRSVFLGELSARDLQINSRVKARKADEARMNAANLKAAALKLKEKMFIREYMNAKNQVGDKTAERIRQVTEARGFLRGYADSSSADTQPWVGSPFAGFGDPATETRINPDLAQDIEIVDADIGSVKEYGVENWMQDPAAVESRVNSSQWSQTEGKEVLQTLVDYPQRPSESVVGMPIPSVISEQLKNAQIYAQATASEQNTAPDYVRMGLYALAAWLVFR